MSTSEKSHAMGTGYPHGNIFVNSSNILGGLGLPEKHRAAVVLDFWALADLAWILGAAQAPPPATFVEELPFNVTRGAAVGLRPSGSMTSASWRKGVELAGLTPVDRPVEGGERLARRLSHMESMVRAAAFAADGGSELVAVIGVQSCISPLAAVCRDRRVTLVAVDHCKTAVRVFAASADAVLEIGAGCFSESRGMGAA